MPKNTAVAPLTSISSLSRYLVSSDQIKAFMTDDMPLIFKDIEDLNIASALLKVQTIAEENQTRILGDTNKWTNKTFRLIYNEFIESKAEYTARLCPGEKVFIKKIINTITELNNFKLLKALNLLKNNANEKNREISTVDNIITEYQTRLRKYDIVEAVYYVYNSTDSVQEAITQIRIIINRVFPIEVKHVEPLRLLQPQTVKPPFRATAVTPLQCVPASKHPIPCFITQIQIGSIENMALKTIAENMIRNFNEISKSSKSMHCAIL